MNYGKKGVTDKKKALNSTGTKWGKKITLLFLQVCIVCVLSIGIIGISAGFGILKGIIETAPDISNVAVEPTRFSTFIYDSQGNQTAKLVAQNSNRIPVTNDKIPTHLANAFVAIEDERFYEHNGIDIRGIFRAAFVGISNGFSFSEGASTITQQLLKNSVFTDWVTEETFAEKAKRKIQEQYLALELEKVMDKSDILLNYMNTINLGQNTLGVQAASLRYFNKQVYELTLSEAAVIAGITQSPSRFNPITNPENNATRREKVLDNMLNLEMITLAEYNEAMADDPYSRIQITNEDNSEVTINSYFDDAVTEAVFQDLLDAGYNDTQAYTLLYTGGLKIYSTQDPSIQTIADDVFLNEDNYPADTKWQLSYELTIEKANGEKENHSTEMYQAYFKKSSSKFNMLYSSQEAAYEGIEQYKEAQLKAGDSVFAESISLTPQPQVSLTVADQSTGYVVAMIGGRGTKEASRTLNRTISSKRQPGSTFKVLAAFAPALDSAGLTLATVFNDAPYNYADGTPVNNYYKGYRGLNSIRKAITDSMNIITVKTLTQISPKLGYDYLLNFGFSTLVSSEEINGRVFSDIQQATALGGLTRGVTNLELNAAYASIANNGTYIKPILYTKVVDSNGNVILDNTTPSTRQVIKETTAFLLTDAMEDVVTSGTGTAVNFGGMAIAGKTGTTTRNVDVWFAGYTPYYTATTWAGYDNNESLGTSAERNLAKSLWRLVMSQIHKELPSKSFSIPQGIVQTTVCSQSGLLPIPGLCDGTLHTEYFDENTVPSTSCNVHYQGNICNHSRLPASDACPFKVEGVLTLVPQESTALSGGSSTLTSDNSVVVGSLESNSSITYCEHTYEFMSNPNIDAIINQQREEINQRNIAAQQAIDAAAAAAGQ
ncbi:MAG: transglycosylase domain-containing protein [Lachnospiraceae bacterium]